MNLHSVKTVLGVVCELCGLQVVFSGYPGYHSGGNGGGGYHSNMLGGAGNANGGGGGSNSVLALAALSASGSSVQVGGLVRFWSVRAGNIR